MRCAICFVPPPDDALTLAAAAWLRRDPYSGRSVVAPVDGLTDADHAYITAIPRRYGFHAAMKPVFELAPSRTIHELERWLDNFVVGTARVSFEFAIDLIDGCFAIVTRKRERELDLLAARVVTEFDAFRCESDDSDRIERDTMRLSGDALSNYVNWGSPDVFARFRFYMPLTNPIPCGEREHVRLVLDRHFRSFTGSRLTIGQLVLAVEPEPNAPFLVRSSHELSAAAQLRIA